MRCADFALQAWLAGLGLLVGSTAQAHKSSDAYVSLSGGGGAAVVVRVDVALRDLDVALDLDTDGDGELTWAEVRAAWPAIETYVLAHFQLDGCALPAATRALERRIDGVYAALQWQSDCRPAAAPAIRYAMLAEVDPTHRGIARIEWAGVASVLRVLVPEAGRLPAPSSASEVRSPTGSAAAAAGAREATTGPASLAAPERRSDAQTVPTPMAATAATEGAAIAPLQFLREGMRHILTGYDHVLFLICLLLPSVMRRTPQGWQPVERWAQAVWPVAGIVTAFTIAHSITLGLAATGTVSLSPAFIEPAIAVTIILAAFDNLRRIFGGRRAIVTFAFGLIHGFGFAGVLAELKLPPGPFAWALLQFNVGLELGQLLIVAVVTTLLFSLRRAALYPAWFIRAGSLAALTVGAIWLVERTANVSLLHW
jgi:hypothetical protein